MTLKLIHGDNQPKPTRRGATGKDWEPMICPECGFSVALTVRVNVMTDGRTIEGGTDMMVCAPCLSAGNVVRLGCP